MANVTGPASSTDTAIARWNGATGTVIQDSTVTVDSAGNISGITAPIADSTTKLATTQFVTNAVMDAVLGAGTVEGGYAADVSTYGLGNLNATYSNGTSGVGATLTNAGTMAALSIDGVSLSVGKRVLVTGQTTGAQNGIYSVTTVGDASTNWVLTRTTDYNTTTPMNDHRYVVINPGGTLNANTAYQQTSTITTIGTDSLTFVQYAFSALGYIPVELAVGHMLIGSANAIAFARAMSGDATISSTGVITIKSSVALAGSPTTTTQSAADNSTKIATTAYVDSAVAAYSATFNNQSGTTYTLASTDTGKTVTLNNASAITVTLPNSLSAGFTCECIQLGAGQVTFSAASGATLKNRQSFTKIAGQNGAVRLVVTGNSGGTSAVYNLAGDCA